MLLIKTKATFIKKNKKTKHGKKTYKKKNFITLQNGDITTQVNSIKITKMKKPIEKPVFDKNTPGWNQALQDLFKVYPPIPQIKKDEPSSLSYFTSLLVKHKIDNNEVDEQQKNELLDMLNKEKLNYTTYSSNPTLKNEITELHKINIEHMISKISKISNDTFSKLPNMTDEEIRETFNTNLNKKIEEYNIKNMFTGIIISLDWDDVIYHLMQKNIEFVEKEYGIKDVHNEITDYYYLYRTYPKIADELWNHPENYISADLVNGAKEFYQELVNLVGEDKIQIVTSSMENVIPLKDKMIRERFGINCKIVHSIFGKHKKYEFTKDTLLIDDFVGNIKEHYIHNLNYGIVFNHMNLDYIKKECDQEGFLHVTTFKDIIEKVKLYLEYLKK